MNETIVRAALNAATDGLEPYEVLGPALRQARRRRIARALAAPATVVLVVALAVLGWAQVPSTPARPADSLGGLPDRLHDPRSRMPNVSDQPSGPVAALYTGTDYASLTDRLYAVLWGPAGYRVTDRWNRDDMHPGEDLLLSPAGDQLVYAGETVVVLDLGTGRRRTVPDSARMEPLAWSPDNRTVAVTVGPETTRGGRKTWGGLGLLDTETGEYRSLANPAGRYTPGFAVAFSRDGQLLAYQGDNGIFVVGLDGADRGDVEVEEGSLLAGKGAFTPDGRSIAVSAGEGCCVQRLELHPVSDEEDSDVQQSSTVGDASALRVLGWTPDGTPVAVAYRPVSGYGSMPQTVPTGYGVVRKADVVTIGSGSSLIATPSGVLAVDLADEAIATGKVVAAPGPPLGLGPPFPLSWRDAYIFGIYSVSVVFPVLAVVLLMSMLVRRRFNLSTAE